MPLILFSSSFPAIAKTITDAKNAANTFFFIFFSPFIIIQLNLQFYKKPYYSLSDQVSVNIYSISMDYSSF